MSVSWNNAFDRITKEFCRVELQVDKESDEWWYLDDNGWRHEYDNVVKLPNELDLKDLKDNPLTPMLVHMYEEIDSLKMKLRVTSVTASAAWSRSGPSRCT